MNWYAICNHNQARSQDLEKGGGGAILKEWEKCKRPWPEFSLFLNQFHTVCPEIKTEFLGKLGNSNGFSAKIRWSPKKKKRSSPKLRLIFRPKSEFQTFEGGLCSYGGLFSIFDKKSASKAPKTCDFAYFTSQWGGSSPPAPPWLRYWPQPLPIIYHWMQNFNRQMWFLYFLFILSVISAMIKKNIFFILNIAKIATSKNLLKLLGNNVNDNASPFKLILVYDVITAHLSWR